MPSVQRKCPTPGCPTLTNGGHCPQHARNRERTRGTTTQRGYGWDYQQARAKALDGATHCWKCGQPFTPTNPATGGHAKDVRAGGTIEHGIKAECRRCNYGRQPAPDDGVT